jgi:hypothetical protein
VPASLQRVPLGRFPAFTGTTRHSDSLPSIPPRFVAFAWRYPSALLRSLHDGESASPSWPGCWSSGPLRSLSKGEDRASQVPEDPLSKHALLFDPGRTSLPGRCGRSVLPSAETTASAPPTMNFGAPSHGLLGRCLRFAACVAASRARLASNWWPALVGRGWLPAGFQRRFRHVLLGFQATRPPSSGFAWRTASVMFPGLGRHRSWPRIAGF